MEDERNVLDLIAHARSGGLLGPSEVDEIIDHYEEIINRVRTVLDNMNAV